MKLSPRSSSTAPYFTLWIRDDGTKCWAVNWRKSAAQGRQFYIQARIPAAIPADWSAGSSWLQITEDRALQELSIDVYLDEIWLILSHVIDLKARNRFKLMTLNDYFIERNDVH